jgi:membrane protease subunit HflK
MPWQSGNGGGNNPWGGGGGNPWGGGGSGGGGGDGPRNPWGNRGSGGGSGGGQGPDLDNLLRQGRDRLKQSFPGSGGGGKIWGYALAGVLALWVATTSVYRVNADEVGVIVRFGEYVRTTGPGLQLKLPSPIETVFKPRVTQENTIEIGTAGGEGNENLVLTGDQNIVDVAYTIRWRIGNAEQFLFNIRDQERTIREVSESAMREVMSQTSMDNAIGQQRAQVATAVERRVQNVLDSYRGGVNITGVFIRQIDPPQAVVSAFRDVTTARQDAFTFVNQANAYRQQLVARAQGDAARFDAVYAQYRIAPEVTRRRIYLETMEQVLSGTQKVIIDGENVMPFLPLPQMQAAGRNSVVATAPREP